MSKKRYTVCLDPGHGPGTVNGSPDGSYKEAEFTWDMYRRIRPLLEQQGVSVVGTRVEGDKPSLTERANISNNANADLFLSLHSNAEGNDGWGSANGLIIFTSMGPETAPRNVAARDLLDAFRKAGIKIRGSGLAYNDSFTVLVKTNAPACLIEYGFHTNKADVELLKDGEYHNRLAVATAKGACTFLGVPYEEEPSPQEEKPDPWAKEAWEKATMQGIFDGTRPKEALTRQEAAVVLDRLGLLDMK